MSGSEALKLSPAVASGLERLGWRLDEPQVRDVVPAIMRGTSVVMALPPAPAWAGPALAGLIQRLETEGGRALVLAHEINVRELGALQASLAAATPIRIEAASGPTRAARRVAADSVDILVLSPETALALHSRSAFHPERFTAVVFAWPEGWDADAALSAIAADLPRDSQRIVLTSAPDRLGGSDGVIERYARKALVIGDRPPAALAAPVATVPAAWQSRTAAIAALLEVIDPVAVTIWTADHRDHRVLEETFGGAGSGVTIATRETPRARGAIICYDPPTPAALQDLTAAGDVTVLVPPGCEDYLARVAPSRRPMDISRAVAAELRHDASLRQQIADLIDAGNVGGGLHPLLPLFERYEPQQVAAALLCLWRAAPRPASQPAVALATPASGTATVKLWVGVGKKDDATVADLVAVLVREVGVDRSLIGKIELRDTFAMVEVPAADAERIARGLTGMTIRRRKVAARIDRGPSARPARAR